MMRHTKSTVVLLRVVCVRKVTNNVTYLYFRPLARDLSFASGPCMGPTLEFCCAKSRVDVNTPFHFLQKYAAQRPLAVYIVFRLLQRSFRLASKATPPQNSDIRLALVEV